MTIESAPILVASDLSSRSDRPVDRAFGLASERSCPLILLHVLDQPETGALEQEERLRNLVSSDLGSRASDVEVVIARGSVPATIARIADERDCQLVVAGPARFNSPVDFVLGTAVDFLVRHASVPVLVVKRRPNGPYRRLLVAVDFSDCSRAAVEAASALFPAAEIRIVHGCHAAYEAWLDKEATVRDACEEAQEEMRSFLAVLPEDVRRRVHSAVEVGELQDIVDRSLNEDGFDLLVLGTHGRGGFAHATIGSRAAQLLVSSSSDVLMVRGAAIPSRRPTEV